MMRLAVTIDTEEDNWGDYTNTSYSVENIKRIPSLQKIFNEYNVIPTYLVTYPVATNRESVEILKAIHREGMCEIGMHCHPWSTPPFEEERIPYNSMLCNLPYDLQQKKMSALHVAIEKNFGIRPKSFRAGRWGYNGDTAMVLKELGYRVDTSVTPFIDWSEDHGPDFSQISPEPYRFKAPKIFESRRDGDLTEIPATIGYLKGNFGLCNSVDRLLSSTLGKMFRLKGLLSKAGLLNKVLLSPEGAGADQMIFLTRVLMKKKYEVLNMFLHSTSLQMGLSFLVKTKEDELRFLNSIREYLTFAREAGIRAITLSEAADVI